MNTNPTTSPAAGPAKPTLRKQQMTVIIIGAGTIGQSIAEILVSQGNDVIAVDRSKEALERLENCVDVQTIEGNGCDPRILEAAQVGRAEVVMAMTSDEETNLLAAAAAKHLGASKSIARVRSPHFLRPEGFDYRRALGIDMVLSPEILTAAEIVKHLDNPDALALEFYAQGKVQLVQYELEPAHPFCGVKLRDLRMPAGVLAVLISRGETLLIPTGEVELCPADKITLLGKSGALAELKDVTPKSAKGRFNAVTIAGGGEIGAPLAAALEPRIRSVKIIEKDLDRCRQLGVLLDKAHILHGDATTRSFLSEERVGQVDVFIAAMKSDEDNIMTALLAKELGAGKCVAVVKRPDYTPLLLESTRIDLALSPRQITAAKVLALVKRGLIYNVSLLEDGRAEIIEFRAGRGSPLLDRPLKDIEFPAGSLVGMIGRGNAIHIPRGNDQIHEGDTVIMITLAEVSKDVEALF